MCIPWCLSEPSLFLPDEFNRVIIPVKRGEENTDYINASFIDVSKTLLTSANIYSQLTEISLREAWRERYNIPRSVERPHNMLFFSFGSGLNTFFCHEVIWTPMLRLGAWDADHCSVLKPSDKLTGKI